MSEVCLEMEEIQPVVEVEIPPEAEIQPVVEEENCGGENEGAVVVKCSSRDGFRRKSNLLRRKIKSRLTDLPKGMKCGFLGVSGEKEENNPLLEDIPDSIKRDIIDFWVLLEGASFIVLLSVLVSIFTYPYLKSRSLWKINLWQWDVLALVLICGRLMSSWIVKVIVLLIERNFFVRKRVLYFIYGVKKAIQNCLWLGLVLIVWHFFFNETLERETSRNVFKTVTKVLVCLLVSMLVWLVKTVTVKFLASSFHLSTFFDRIQESLFNQYVIERLLGSPLIEVPITSSRGRERVIGSRMHQGCPQIDHLIKLNPKNVSAWNMKRMIKLIQHGTLSTLHEQIHDSTCEDETTTNDRSEWEAKATARKIYHNMVGEGSSHIDLEDIMRYMQEDEALRIVNLFEGASENMKISESALKNWVVNVFSERRALALTLNDTKMAVNKLHRVVNILVGIIIMIVWVLILGIATTNFLLFVVSQLLVTAFIFGNMCKTVFEAFVFLFVMHPFDIGDRCEIEGVQMVVEEMNILTTVFMRHDNQKIIYPNNVLATKAINNYYRSPVEDEVEFYIHITTPAEKTAQMKQRINSYIENKEDHWHPAPIIIFKNVESTNMVRIAVCLKHRMNPYDINERSTRRSMLLGEIIQLCKELDIEHICPRCQ